MGTVNGQNSIAPIRNGINTVAKAAMCGSLVSVGVGTGALPMVAAGAGIAAFIVKVDATSDVVQGAFDVGQVSKFQYFKNGTFTEACQAKIVSIAKNGGNKTKSY